MRDITQATQARLMRTTSVEQVTAHKDTDTDRRDMTRAINPKMIPEPDQEEAINRMVSEPTCAVLNASTMGSGKTLMGTEVALRLNAKTVLLIGPLGTFYGWMDTILAQTEGAVTLRKIDSTKAGKQAFIDLADGKDGWYFIGREYFRTKEWAGIKPSIAIIDECHFAQNRKSKSYKVLMTLNPHFRLSMSGTPYGNKFEGFWAVTRWLWPTIVPRSFWKWAEKWAKMVYSPFSSQEINGELNEGAYANSLPCYIRLAPDHKIDVVTEVRYVDLVPAQKKIYDKFEEDLVVWLDNNPMIAEVPIAARIRLRQITLAVPSITPEGDIVFADDAVSTKYNALKEIVDDNPDTPMLLLTDSQKYARMVVQRLNGSKGKTVAFEWSGTATQAQREVAKQAFLKGELQFIVAVIPAIAEGVDGLQNVCSTIVWLSHSDSNIMNQQVFDRIRRRGQKEQVRVFDILARNTFDDPQAQSLFTKEVQMRASLKKKE